jgi:DNA-binding transcriptional MocR family regulator
VTPAHQFPLGITMSLPRRLALLEWARKTPLSDSSRRRLVRDGLQLGFAAVDEAEIRRGVRELAVALEGVANFSTM